MKFFNSSLTAQKGQTVFNRWLLQTVAKAIRYGVIGASCALIDLGLFAFFVSVTSFSPVIINVFTYFIGTLLSFYTNARFTFCCNDKMFRRASLFFFAAVVGLSLSSFLLHAAPWLGIGVITMKIISMIFVFGVQFSFNNFVTFG
ncbi:GtrA family protein [Desulfovibrio inopinatus]|uniref:GtrA family protein n=1 Tax=Desulfovibrio inopinatus TaxID=102109 RepID=UPI00047F25BA|nr:GtrA family protein [Desulfovibrio inopinatus]